MNQTQAAPQRSPTRRLQKQRTRNTVTRSAVELFSRNGLRDTRTQDVARHAGVSHGTIFTHFPTRSDLVTAAIGTFAQSLTDRLYDLVRADAGLPQILAAHLAAIGEVEPMYIHLVREAADLPEPARNHWLTVQSAIGTYFGDALNAEIAAGRVTPMAQALAFNTWIGLLHHYLANHDLFAPGKSVIGEYGGQLAQHYLQLISNKDETS